LAITRKHVLPNVAPILTVQLTIEFAGAILVEAALSYLGLGVQPPQPSWGRMLSEAQTLLFVTPQLALWPGLCIVAAVLGFNLLGDGLRDATDPRLRPLSDPRLTIGQPRVSWTRHFRPGGRARG
ncbi:MAG: ABC transporter permease, partial [Geminicoccaceae bacterium]